MKFATSLVLSALAVAGVVSAAPQLEKRYDERQIWNFSKSGATSAADACNKWRCACVNYVPQDSSLTFGYTLCRPGDDFDHGNNPSTEVTAYCTFTKPGQRAPVSINMHTAKAVGFTAVSSNN